MNRSILFASLFAVAVLLGGNVAFAQKTRTIISVDTIRATELMRERIAADNAPIERRIAMLRDSVGILEKDLRQLNDQAMDAKHLMAFCGQKYKEESVKQRMVSFLQNNLHDFSREALLGCISQKDVEKARKSKTPDAKLQELDAKTREKLAKKVAKGDFTDPLLSSFFNYVRSRLDERSNALESRLSAYDKEISALQKQLNSVTAFSRYAFLETLPGMDFPTKTTITITDPDYLTYDERIRKYYTGIENIPSVTGKFDGMIEDTVTAFPVESSKCHAWFGDDNSNDDYYGSDDYSVFRRIIFISRKGSVPDFEIQLIREDGNFLFNKEYGPDFNIEPLNSIWYANDCLRTGILLDKHIPEGTANSAYTYVFDNGSWANKAPMHPKYMSFDSCVEKLRENGHPVNTLEFNHKDPEGYESGKGIKLLPVTLKSIGLPEEHCTNDSVWIKSSPALQTLTISGNKLMGIDVIKDAFNSGDDGLAAFYDPTGKPEDRFIDIYYYHWNGPEGESLNGEEIDAMNCWTRRIKCTIDPSTGEWIQTVIKQEWEE